MSENSTPSDPGPTMPPAGWYPDPADQLQERYWDGAGWTHSTRPATGSVNAPAAQPLTAPPAQPGYPQQSYPQQSYPTQAYPQQPGQPYPGAAGQYGVQQQAWAPQGVRAARGPLTADGVPLAGWWWRVLAYLIDAVIVGVIAGLITSPWADQLSAATTAWAEDFWAAVEAGSTTYPNIWDAQYGVVTPWLITSAITVALTIFYATWFLALKAATIGQLACGLRVVPVDQGRAHQRLAVRTALIRNIAWQVIGAVPLLGFINLVVPLWSRKRQTWHDMIARTQVVKIN